MPLPPAVRTSLLGALCCASACSLLLHPSEPVDTDADADGDSWLIFEVCDPNPCPQPEGACCFADGSCVVTLEAEVAALKREIPGLAAYQGKLSDPQAMSACLALYFDLHDRASKVALNMYSYAFSF